MVSTIIALAIVASVYVAFSVFVQRRLSNYKRIKEIKKEMDAKMKELKGLGASASREALALKQKEIMTLSSESMKHQIKPTLIILPIFFVLFYVALPMMFPMKSTVTVLGFTVSCGTFFVAVAFVLGILSTIVISIYEKISAKPAPQVPATNVIDK